MSKLKNADLMGWNRNTDLGCDLKTILSSDAHMQTGKEYRGLLRRDNDTIVEEFICKDAHYTFIETLPQNAYRRNPRLYDGEFITLTRWNDGSIRLYFKKLKTDADFSVDGYALAVCNELRQALKGLVEKE